MKVILIENENFTVHRIGGISSYIRLLVKFFEHKKIDYCCVGAGFKNETPAVRREVLPLLGGQVSAGVKLFSISTGKMSNTAFVMKLFFNKGRLFGKMENAIFHFQHPYMALVLRIFRLKNTFVLTLHSKQDQSFRSRRNIFAALVYDRITRRSLPYYHHIIADNPEVLDYYNNRFGLDMSRTSVIPPPVDLNVFRTLNRSVLRKKYDLNEKDKMVLYAGRIEKEKNLKLLISSCSRLTKDLEHLKLWIVGEGSELNPLRVYAQKLDFNNVRFIKTVPAVELAGLMNCADVFALSSLHEGGPIVIKEALACNLPVVSVDVGDVSLVLKGLNGCFVVGYGEEEFAAGLRKAIEQGVREGMRVRVERFGGEEFGERVLGVYEGVRSKE